ncbi:MAG: response regulator [Ignavibacteriales bacterium]|nr:response regulator [Ignavibacteriales bacterium]
MSNHKQILIVDDEPVWLRVLTQLLQTKGYIVREAASGADALSTLQSYEPDLILLDVRMPDMNGFDLLEHIKKLPRLASKPVVFVSAMDDFHAKKVARELGAADYILKPIDEQEVNDVLEKYLPK